MTMQLGPAAQLFWHLSVCIGSTSPQLNRCGARVQVTTQPYYAAEDIGIGGQGACAQGGCFFGVMHYIYKVGAWCRQGMRSVLMGAGHF